jgi:DNA-binding LacI/PurR family transcriptional regulator
LRTFRPRICERDGGIRGVDYGQAAATRHLLDRRPRTTAIIYGNDLMAISGMSAAIDAGLSLPDQLSIVGFDDIPLAAHLRPALTTVRQDATDWGRAAARSLIALVEGEPVPAVTLSPAAFVERSTTSPPRVHRTAVD